MIRNPRRVSEIEARHDRETLGEPSYRDALERFVALWQFARLLNPDFGRDWRADLEADLAVARAVNGLPPSA